MLTIACIIVSIYITLYIPQLSGKIINDVLEIGDLTLLMSLVLQTISLTAVLGIVSFVQRYANGYFSEGIVYEVRNDAFKSLQRQSFAFFDKADTGQLMSRATTDAERVGRFLGFQLRSLIESSLLLAGVIASMVIIDFDLTALSFSLVLILFINFSIFGKKIRPVTHAARECFGNLTAVLWENITGMRVVRSFVREDYEKKKFQKPNEDYYKLMMDAVRLRSTFTPLSGLITGLVTAIIYWYGGGQVINKHLTIDMLYVFSSYAALLMRPMRMLGMIWTGYQQMAAAGERVFEIIDAMPEVKEKPDAITLPPIKGHVVFENVSFGYNKDRLILKKVNLEARPGETVAILGPTGSGKSTVIRLLPRFYDVTSGRILVDGYDIRDVRIESLRKNIGIVPQETFLFNMTVKQNIAYGNPKASIDDIIKVAKIAKAHGFIEKLPHGYDTIIGERGINLSGGQQQRIAIARALLLNHQILILDDSTSSVDVDTEYEIQQALNALLKDRTTFMITQRISTIRNADKIIVLENGSISEEGTHESLVVKKGAYYEIHQTLYEAQKENLQEEIHSITSSGVELSTSKLNGGESE
jgi:ABC-type multidrug transport system fused ATPase/permease subunit